MIFDEEQFIDSAIEVSMVIIGIVMCAIVLDCLIVFRPAPPFAYLQLLCEAFIILLEEMCFAMASMLDYLCSFQRFAVNVFSFHCSTSWRHVAAYAALIASLSCHVLMYDIHSYFNVVSESTASATGPLPLLTRYPHVSVSERDGKLDKKSDKKSDKQLCKIECITA